MSEIVLIVGVSGTGKSTSAETLNSEETFYINIAGKPLPFKGWKSKYKPLTAENPKGNYLSTNNPETIIKTLEYINDKMPHIKNVITDDYQYSMSEEYMQRAKEKGYDKFTDIAQNAWKIINKSKSMRDDIKVFFFTHPETDIDAQGRKFTKAKTIGKMLDNVITLEGMFTVVLFTDVSKGPDNKLFYGFLTQNDGSNTGKSPKGMFEDAKIPNDLAYVSAKMDEYNA